jgi:VanZ family protein
MKSNRIIVLNWLAVFVWLGVIYYFSSQPNLKSELEPLWDLVLRKIAHLTEFFILAFLLFRAYQSYGVNFRQALVFALAAAVGAAGFDEWHQSFTPGRTPSLIDVGVDSFGAILFIGLKIIETKNIKLSKLNS